MTGRLLVNLRWHTEIDEFGKEKWIYEYNQSKKLTEAEAMAGDSEAKLELEKSKAKEGGRTDSLIFWTTLYATPLIWSFLCLMQVLSLRFFWINTSAICFMLSFTNA